MQYPKAKNMGYHTTMPLRDGAQHGGDLLTVAETFQLGDPEEHELREYTSKQGSAGQQGLLLTAALSLCLHFLHRDSDIMVQVSASFLLR